MNFNIDTLLQILKEVNVLLTLLRDLGLHIDGTVNLADLLAFVKK